MSRVEEKMCCAEMTMEEATLSPRSSVSNLAAALETKEFSNVSPSRLGALIILLRLFPSHTMFLGKRLGRGRGLGSATRFASVILSVSHSNKSFLGWEADDGAEGSYCALP